MSELLDGLIKRLNGLVPRGTEHVLNSLADMVYQDASDGKMGHDDSVLMTLYAIGEARAEPRGSS